MSLRDHFQEVFSKFSDESKSQVRIAFFGQPGAGKSSLINFITDQPLAHPGVPTNKTVEKKEYHWQNLTLVDLPGYGTELFPESTFFEKFDIPSLDLFLCVFDGKFHDSDARFFKQLRALKKPCIFVRNKVEDLWDATLTIDQLEVQVADDLARNTEAEVPLIFTSCRKKTGLDELQKAIAGALDEAARQRFFRSGKAYSKDFLEKKKSACDTMIMWAAAASAANAVNPIPILDFSVDVGIILQLFSKIREIYGLTDEKLHGAEHYGKAFIPLVNNVLKYAQKEGIVLLLRQFSGKVVAKSVTKYVPFIGPLIAGSIAFALIKAVADSYLGDCHALALAIMDEELKSNVPPGATY